MREAAERFESLAPNSRKPALVPLVRLKKMQGSSSSDVREDGSSGHAKHIVADQAANSPSIQAKPSGTGNLDQVRCARAQLRAA